MKLCATVPAPAGRAPGTASVRLALALLFVLGVVVMPRDAWWGYGVAGGLLVLAGLGLRVSFAAWLKSLLWLEPFAAGVAVLALFQPDGARVFLGMLARSTLCIACLLLHSRTTPVHETLGVLRCWRVPGLLVTTLELAQRYFYVLLEEVGRMRRARASRTFVSRRGQWWGILSGIIAHSFVRASGRAGRVHAAMLARGWKP